LLISRFKDFELLHLLLEQASCPGFICNGTFYLPKEQQRPHYLLLNSIIACENLRPLSTSGAETGKRRLKGEETYRAIVLTMYRV
jgi:hypothetical protein